MQFSSILGTFLSVTIYTLLVYNFLATVLFCFKRELLTEKKRIHNFQQVSLVITFIGMLIYFGFTKVEATHIQLLPWIWGFLAAHIFSARKKRWINELLGLGILLAITIILFFKQTEIIQLFTEETITTIPALVYIIYGSVGFVLGGLLWQKTSNR
ncbi:hypothetical protein KAOT1_01744 [Kordia algicida OT-1]|uniref:Uncharacterized protein n=2 Tax=Kordia TaxID=221065 RepID=A9E6D9_9FLAO|nr:hypothetical protein KAOT1_01744 [Kordia algicida OT-1]